MYNKIIEFCKVKNIGNIYKNDPNEPTPRVKFLISMIESQGIDYELDKFPIEKRYNYDINWFMGKIESHKESFGYNIVMKGTSDKMVIAHHDIVNPNIDNANDNSCSCINAIMVKKLKPETNVILTDGEEFGGLGSQRLSDQINDGYFGNIKWVLNLELTGKGGEYFFIGDYPGRLKNHILSLFDCPVVQTPYNDSVTLIKNGIDSLVINPLPPLYIGESSVMWQDSVYLDFSILFNCHSIKDTLSTIDVGDMKLFVEKVVLKILE